MAETQRVSPSSAPPLRHRPAPKPRPRHPHSYAAPLRLPLDETQDLRPPEPVVPEPVVKTEAVWEKPVMEAVQERPVVKRRERRAPSPRTPAEQALMTVLVLGLGLTATVLLLDSTLTRADVLLGSTVLLAGAILLTFLEICRRGAPARR